MADITENPTQEQETPIIPVTHPYSETAGNIPTPARLLVGQIAINGADKKLYTKDSQGNIIAVGGDIKWGSIAGDINDQTDLFDAFVTLTEWNKVADFIDGILDGTVKFYPAPITPDPVETFEQALLED